MSYDTVVVGAGLAGLVAALRLAEHGQRVLILARGVGATHLAPATVDVLGYVGERRVDSPAASLPQLLAGAPDHPYARVSAETIDAALAWFRDRVSRLGYAGGLDENLLLPTAVGVAKPSALAPRTMLAGDLRGGGRFLFAGLRGFKDFHPFLLAGNLAGTGMPITARAIELEPPTQSAGDLSGRRLALRLEAGGLLDWLARSLQRHVEGDEHVGLPAVLGLQRDDEVWQVLEHRLERRVFEVPTLPPSIPGIRLYNALTARLRIHGSRVVTLARVVGARTSEGRIVAVEVETGSGMATHRTGAVVLATGGFASGGLELDFYGRVRETVFDLPVARVPAADRPRFTADYFAEQPLAASGVAVDSELHPVDATGRPVYSNLHAAGAIVAGAVPWKEQSGTGISLATGYAAAGAILAPEPARAEEALS